MYKSIIVDIDDDNSLKLFKTFYQDTLLSSFDLNQLEEYDQFISNLTNNNSSHLKYYIIIYLYNDYPIGGIIFDYLVDSNTGFIEYIATNESVRKKGTGTYILKDACERLNNLDNKIRFVACEVEQVKENKEAKHYFWEKFGFKKLDFYYVQPPLEKNKEPVYNMDFGIITKAPGIIYDKGYVDKESLKSLLENYYRPYRDDPYYKDILLKLEKDQDIIKLV